MRSQCVLVSGAALLSALVHVAGGQVPQGDSSAQIKKEWELGAQARRDLEKTDGKIEDAGIIQYLQRLENKLANAGGAIPAAEIRVTRSSNVYVSATDNGVLYISGGLLQRIENEAELAGLLAHELAHTQPVTEVRPQTPAIAVVHDGCVLQANLAAPGTEEARTRQRDGELTATAAAVARLRAAGYDPAGVLDLFSKLAYEHPAWAKAIVPGDLLALRVKLEADPVPVGGYRIDSSEFVEAHAALETALSRKH